MSGLTEALLGLATAAVVPLGLSLHPDVPARLLAIAVAAGALAAVGLLTGSGAIGVALVTPWLVVSLVAAIAAAVTWLRGRRDLAGVVWVAAPAYLVVGGVWLLLDRAGAEPVGVTQPFVLLTAVHFHYAGFVSALLAGLVRRVAAQQAPVATTVAVVCVVGAPPIVALGFTFAGALQIVGAVVLTVGLLVMAGVTVRVVVPPLVDRPARALLVVSSVAVVVPMVLAVQWAVGWNLGTPALSIPDMARTHGVLNALGFALCGLLGWRRISAAGAPPPP